MNKEILIEKLLDLAEGRETNENWQLWWKENETQLETILNRLDFLKLKPSQNGTLWSEMLVNQKVAINILEKEGISFKASSFYHDQYKEELDAFVQDQKKAQQKKQKQFKVKYSEWFSCYPKFSNALADNIDPFDKILPAATAEQINNQEKILEFSLPTQVRDFFLLSAGIDLSAGFIIELSHMFILTIHNEHYCVLGEFFYEADGDQILLRPDDETVYYYAHEQNKVKRLSSNMNELIENKIAKYINEN